MPNLPDYQFLTVEEIEAILGKNITSSGTAVMISGALTALEILISALKSAETLALTSLDFLTGLATFLVSTFALCEQEITTVLDVVGFSLDVYKAVEEDIRRSIDDTPESIYYSPRHWNRILGSALNYKCDTDNGKYVVREYQDTDLYISYDFSKMWGFQTNLSKEQLWLSEEMRLLLNCNIKRD